MLMKLFIALLVVLAAWQIIDPDFRLSDKEVVVRKALPMDVSYESIDALSYLNSIRSKMNMLPFAKNSQLTDAAKAHAKYLSSNNENTHEEIPGHRNFLAEKPVERAFKMGYNSAQVSENLSTHHQSGRKAVDGLFSAIYHRFGFLNTTLNEIGVGVSQDEFDPDRSAFVFLMGNSDLNALCSGKGFQGGGTYWKGCRDASVRIREKDYLQAIQYGKQNNPDLIVYPYDEQREVPPAFYSEVPDPLPRHDVSGFPVSIAFNDYYYKDVSLLSFTLSDYHSNVIDVLLMDNANDPHQRFTKNQFAIFPLQRLEYNMKYRAEVMYTVKDKIKKHTWHFYTKRITEEFHTVDKLYDTLTIVPHQSYVIYFRPVDEHDLLTNLQFPEEVDIQFLDHNTIKLTLMSNEIDAFILNAGSKQLRITVVH